MDRRPTSIRTTLALSVLALTLIAPWALGQETRFALFNDCKPVDLIVIIEDPGGETDLTEDRIQTSVESRLRAARLYDSDEVHYLFVYVHVVGRGHSIETAFKKWVFDPVSEEYGFASVWVLTSTGTHGGDGSDFLGSISEITDRFLVEYLRVNDAACGP